MVWNGYHTIPKKMYDSNLFRDLNIKHVRCNKNLATACNSGIIKSCGKYIIRLDADDYFHTDLLLSSYNAIENNICIDAVWCNFIRVYNNSGIKQFVLQRLNVLEHACGVLYKRKVFDELNGYDESLEYQESFDFWARFRKLGFRSFHIDRALYNYRQHSKSMSTNTSNRNQARIDIIMRLDRNKLDCFRNYNNDTGI